jgi:hypothetical protein
MDQAVTHEMPQQARQGLEVSFCPPFRKVGIEEIGASWAFVERGLQAILDECPDEHWTPRDIRRYLREGRAALFVRADGFVVLERSREPITSEPYVNVWLMWFEPEHLKREEVAAWLDELTKAQACEWWQLSSPRMGWGRYLHGICTHAYTTWRRYV